LSFLFSKLVQSVSSEKKQSREVFEKEKRLRTGVLELEGECSCKGTFLRGAKA